MAVNRELTKPIYEVTHEGLELPHGARFTVTPPPATGGLCLFIVGQHLILGRLIADMILQPCRWIYVGDAIVRCLGEAVLLFAIF